MTLWAQLKCLWVRRADPPHLQTGRRGERAAKRYLQSGGLKFLAANFVSRHGEIDLIFRDGECLVFVEVKTRSADSWTRPAKAVDRRKRRLLSLSALEYLRLVKHPEVPVRFDVVEVVMAEGVIEEIRHLPNTFSLSSPYRYG